MTQDDDIHGCFPWEMGQLPFNWGPLDEPSNGAPLPDVLPFALDVDARSAYLKQAPRAETARALELAYRRGSQMTGMMDESGIGLQYAEDYIKHLCALRGSADFTGVRVLEIGCGSGYLLHRLSLMGARVVGIEPGNHGQERASKYGIRIVRDFFPSPMVQEKFDLIILYAVLEHFEQPERILAQLAGSLLPSGKIALAVPNCEPYIQTGDISMLLHEHWGYYTPSSLAALLSMNGGEDVAVGPSGFGGCLYASAGMSTATTERAPVRVDELEALKSDALRFRRLAIEGADKLGDILRSNAGRSRSTGIFVASRAVNALAWKDVELTGCRFFDDNAQYHGRYFPGIPIPIESRHALIESPTDLVIIMSQTFGRKIMAELKTVLPATTMFVSWDDIYGAARLS